MHTADSDVTPLKSLRAEPQMHSHSIGETNRRLRDRLPIAVMSFAYLAALLAFWEADISWDALSGALSAFTLGLILGGLTAVVFVGRGRWRLDGDIAIPRPRSQGK
jgi:hypothetical protein